MSTSSSTSVSPAVSIPFTGISQYASDFQATLDKAVQVANIPVTLLQSQDSMVLQKESALGTLSTAVANLATSLTSLGTLSSNQALGATSSDSSIVSATANGATAATSYTINSITSLAAAASERTTNPYADSSSTPVSSTGEMELVAGSFDQKFAVTTNTLVGLRDQINSMNAGVTASILTTSGGNYLSIAANSTGASTLKLIDDPNGTPSNILTGTNQGSDAVFSLNGINVDQTTNTVNSVIPGVTLSLLNTTPTTAPVTISLQSDPTQLSSALQDLVTNYNALATAINAQTGQSGGALAGDSVIAQLQTALRQMTSQTSSTGTIQSLSDLGITFDNSGQASFDQTAFSSLDSTQISDAFKFLGSATTGLAGFAQTFTQYSDPISGIIQSEVGGLKQQDTDLQAQIGTLNTRISSMQATLTQQLEAADALQAELQQQQTNVGAALQGVSLVLYGKNETQF